jgi:1-phosphatidylinositol phosphodiesterase
VNVDVVSAPLRGEDERRRAGEGGPMSRTKCTIVNRTDRPIEVAARLHDGRTLAFRGTDWAQVPAVGTTIAPQASATLGTLGDPGLVETDHWGWLYFDVLQAGGVRLPCQLFLRRSSHGIQQASLGYYDADSAYSRTGGDDRTMPLGHLGNVEDGADGHERRFIVTKDMGWLRPAPAMETWMSTLPPERPVSALSIPGTHDSGARNVAVTTAIVGFLSSGAMFPTPENLVGSVIMVCQSMTIAEQLAAGIRYLDVRLGIHGAGDEALWIHHSIIDFLLPFSSVLDQCAAFLAAHPSEGILLCVKHEKDGDRDAGGVEFEFEVQAYVRDARWAALFRTSSSAPTVEDMRGHLVLLRRFERGPAWPPPTLRHPRPLFGVDFDKWPDNADPGWIPACRIYLQDKYKNISVATKWKHVEATLVEAAKTGGANASRWFINNASAALGLSPRDLARTINAALRKHLIGKPNARVGTFVMDFPDASLIKRIVMANHG